MKRVPLGLGLVAGLAGLGALALLAGCMLAAPGLAGPGVGGAGLTSPLIGSFDAAGEFGATQGGVQDMGLARELIASGRVPPPEAFVVEGMFSEHDLGLSGDACERTLCLRAALGIAPTLEDEPSGWVQIAMSSTIDVDAFERPGLTLIATVDVSGLSGGDAVECGLNSKLSGRQCPRAGHCFALSRFGSHLRGVGLLPRRICPSSPRLACPGQLFLRVVPRFSVHQFERPARFGQDYRRKGGGDVGIQRDVAD